MTFSPRKRPIQVKPFICDKRGKKPLPSTVKKKKSNVLGTQLYPVFWFLYSADCTQAREHWCVIFWRWERDTGTVLWPGRGSGKVLRFITLSTLEKLPLGPLRFVYGRYWSNKRHKMNIWNIMTQFTYCEHNVLLGWQLHDELSGECKH